MKKRKSIVICCIKHIEYENLKREFKFCALSDLVNKTYIGGAGMGNPYAIISWRMHNAVGGQSMSIKLAVTVQRRREFDVDISISVEYKEVLIIEILLHYALYCTTCMCVRYGPEAFDLSWCPHEGRITKELTKNHFL